MVRIASLEQLAKELLCRLRIAPPLYEDVQDVVVLNHHPRQVMALTVDCEENCVHMPCIPGLRATALQPMGIVLSKLSTPLTHGFVGDGNTTFEQEFLHVAGAQVTREESQTPWRTIAAGKQECLEC